MTCKINNTKSRHIYIYIEGRKFTEIWKSVNSIKKLVKDNCVSRIANELIKL